MTSNRLPVAPRHRTSEGISHTEVFDVVDRGTDKFEIRLKRHARRGGNSFGRPKQRNNVIRGDRCCRMVRNTMFVVHNE